MTWLSEVAFGVGLSLVATACGSSVAVADTDGGTSTGGPSTSATMTSPTDPSSSGGSSGSSSGSTTAESTTGSSSSESSSGTTGGLTEPGLVQAIPPVRVREVCESLGENCILSTACSGDYEGAMTDFTDQLQVAVEASGDEQAIDILFVVDNSSGMGPMQLMLAREFPGLLERIQGLQGAGGGALDPSVNIMATTSDFGNPLCTAFQSHEPARGAPIATGCNSRIDYFTGLGVVPEVFSEACTEVCPVDVEPTDPFIHFDAAGDNVPDVEPYDVDGDGTDDPPVARALACIGPQGIDGCGYESQLENMLQALNPAADWNTGNTPFLRPDAALAIVLLTNEADCSIQNYDIMTDAAYQEMDPGSGTPAASSALCWNAGVVCDSPGLGVYSNCMSVDNGLQPTSRYINYLVDELSVNQGKEVLMLGIVGVPEGGADELVIRDWREEDILPEEAMAGVTAEDKQFNFGIGPGCGGAE